jgi:hypothetical protein
VAEVDDKAQICVVSIGGALAGRGPGARMSRPSSEERGELTLPRTGEERRKGVMTTRDGTEVGETSKADQRASTVPTEAGPIPTERPVEDLFSYSEDPVDFMGAESFPASDPPPAPSSIAPASAEVSGDVRDGGQSCRRIETL